MWMGTCIPFCLRRTSFILFVKERLRFFLFLAAIKRSKNLMLRIHIHLTPYVIQSQILMSKSVERKKENTGFSKSKRSFNETSRRSVLPSRENIQLLVAFFFFLVPSISLGYPGCSKCREDLILRGSRSSSLWVPRNLSHHMIKQTRTGDTVIS